MKKYIATIFIISSAISPFSVHAQQDINPISTAQNCLSLQNNMGYRAKDINTNNEVSALQDFLESQNFMTTEPSGYFGLLTVKAVTAFQNANGIVGTGYVGAITRAKINAISCGLSASSTNYYSIPGCTSIYGYSTITGQPCTTATQIITTPFRITYPNGGETFYQNQSYNITWIGTDGSGATSYAVYLYQNGNYVRNIGTATISSQSGNTFAWTVPADIATGTYTIKIGPSGLGGMSNPFFISSSLTGVYTLPYGNVYSFPGCNGNLYSTVNGQYCGIASSTSSYDGCYSGAIYSVTTGQYCGVNSGLYNPYNYTNNTTNYGSPSISISANPPSVNGSLSIPVGDSFTIIAQPMNATGSTANFHVDSMFSCSLVGDGWSMTCTATRRGSGTFYVSLRGGATATSNSIRVTAY